LSSSPIGTLLCTHDLSIGRNRAMSLYGDVCSSIDYLGGIDHPDLLISLAQLSFPLLLPVSLKLFADLLFIFFGLVFSDIILDELVNSFTRCGLALGI
jgi:hypothetical protein